MISESRVCANARRIVLSSSSLFSICFFPMLRSSSLFIILLASAELSLITSCHVSLPAPPDRDIIVSRATLTSSCADLSFNTSVVFGNSYVEMSSRYSLTFEIPECADMITRIRNAMTTPKPNINLVRVGISRNHFI